MNFGFLPTAICLAIACACATLATAADLPESPALTVKTLSGEDMDLGALRGRVVLVHFWATWCAPCIKEMPALENFYESYRARGVEVIALSEDRTRDIDEVHHMVQRMNMRYPVAMAHKASRNTFGDPNALPVTFVIDTNGVVRAQMRPDTQPVTEENLVKIVEPLLAVPEHDPHVAVSPPSSPDAARVERR